MPSRNERARWARAWDQMTARMERQKSIIARLVHINTEAMAALEEIAAGDPSESSLRQAVASRRRAQEALDRIKGSAAADTVQEAESVESEFPVEDPRSRNGA